MYNSVESLFENDDYKKNRLTFSDKQRFKLRS